MSRARKARERFLLDRFLDIAGLSASEVRDAESPDFVLELQGRAVGIEVTEVFIEPSAQAPSLRANESMTDRIVARAREIHNNAGRRPAFVAVAFFDAQVSQHLRRDEVAAALANLVERLTSNGGGLRYWQNNYSDPSLGAIATVSVFPESDASEGRWCVNRAGWVQPLLPSHLAPAVAEKNLKYERYLQRVPEVWLLMAIDSSAPSQLFDVDASLDLSGLGSKFDKTFFVRTFPPVLVRYDRPSP